MWPSCCCSSTESVLSSCSNRRVKESNVSNRNLLLTCLKGADVLKKENDRRKTLLVSSDTVHPMMLLGFDMGSDWDWPMSLYIADIMMPAQEKVWTSVSDALLLLRVFFLLLFFLCSVWLETFPLLSVLFHGFGSCIVASFGCMQFAVVLHFQPFIWCQRVVFLVSICCLIGFTWELRFFFFFLFNHFTIHDLSKLCAAVSEDKCPLHLSVQIPARLCDSAWGPKQLGQILELSLHSALTKTAHDFSVGLPKDRYIHT